MADQNLQDYINQSRQQGLTDEQIKQNLIAAGWNEQQIAEASGRQTSSNTPAPSPASPPSKKFPLWAKLLIAAVIFMVLVGIAIPFVGFFALNKFKDKIKKETGLDIQSDSISIDLPGQSSLCGDFPSDAPDQKSFIESSVIPPQFPKDMPYPKAEIIGHMKLSADDSGDVLILCSNKSIKEVVDFYADSNSSWKLDKQLTPGENMVSQQIILRNDKGGEYPSASIVLLRTENKTVIQIQPLEIPYFNF